MNESLNKALQSLQGSWAITSLELEGQSMPGSGRIEVQGNRFTTLGMGADYAGTLRIDASKTPWHLDMQFDAGPEKGNTNLCLCEPDGDGWRLSIATRGSTRPSSFTSLPGSGIAVETLRRQAAAAPEVVESPSTSQTEFEGVWNMVSGILDGNPLDDASKVWVRRVTTGNQTTVYAGPQVMMAFEFNADPASKHIDYKNTAGAQKGKTQLGIYDWEGGQLKICMAAPGQARPARLESGKGLSLTIWKRK